MSDFVEKAKKLHIQFTKGVHWDQEHPIMQKWYIEMAERIEFRKCYNDPLYFYENYCLINGKKPIITDLDRHYFSKFKPIKMKKHQVVIPYIEIPIEINFSPGKTPTIESLMECIKILNSTWSYEFIKPYMIHDSCFIICRVKPEDTTRELLSTVSGAIWDTINKTIKY